MSLPVIELFQYLDHLGPKPRVLRSIKIWDTRIVGDMILLSLDPYTEDSSVEVLQVKSTDELRPIRLFLITRSKLPCIIYVRRYGKSSTETPTRICITSPTLHKITKDGTDERFTLRKWTNNFDYSKWLPQTLKGPYKNDTTSDQ